MSILAYVLAGMHVAFLLVYALSRVSFQQKSRKQLILCALALLSLSYFVLASGTSSLVVPLIVAEAVGLMRLFFHNFSLLSTAGSSVMRHAEHVLKKSITASIFTTAVSAGLLALFGNGTLAMDTLMAWPAFFAVEYGLRLRRANQLKQEEADRQARIKAERNETKK